SETKGNIMQFNQELVSQADTFHSMIATAAGPVPLPQGVKHYAIIGYGVSTLTGYRLYDASVSDGDYYLTIGGANPRNVILKPEFGNGDGTVPIWSAEINSVTDTYCVPYTSGSLYSKVFQGGSYYDRSSEHGKL